MVGIDENFEFSERHGWRRKSEPICLVDQTMWQRDVFDLILAMKAENNSSNVWSGEILKANSRARSEVREPNPLLPWELGRCFLQSPIDGVWRATAPFYHEKSGYSVNRMDKDLIQVKKSSPLVICQVSKHDICTTTHFKGQAYMHYKLTRFVLFVLRSNPHSLPTTKVIVV